MESSCWSSKAIPFVFLFDYQSVYIHLLPSSFLRSHCGVQLFSMYLHCYRNFSQSCSAIPLVSHHVILLLLPLVLCSVQLSSKTTYVHRLAVLQYEFSWAYNNRPQLFLAPHRFQVCHLFTRKPHPDLCLHTSLRWDVMAKTGYCSLLVLRKLTLISTLILQLKLLSVGYSILANNYTLSLGQVGVAGTRRYSLILCVCLTALSRLLAAVECLW